MTTRTTEIGGQGRGFPTTSWTLVRNARQGGPEVEACWNQLVALYWKPVYWYVRQRWNKSNEDAKDLTQEFFTVFLEREKLADMSEGHTRFRLFLRACLENFLLTTNRDQKRKKRGGGARHVAIDGPCELDVPARDISPEEAFDQAWAQTILKGCLESLEELYTSTKRATYWQVFSRYHLATEEPTYQECANALGISVDDVQNRLRHARKTLKNLVRERVRDTLADPADLEDELRALRSLGA